jgi:anti-anti-sigma factor
VIQAHVAVREYAEVPGVSVGTVSGEVDLANAGGIGRQILAAVPNTALGLVLDLSGVEYLDSAGVNLLFVLAERLEVRQQRLEAVVPAASHLRAVLRIAQVDAMVGIWESVEQAAAAAGRPRIRHEP